MNTQEIKENSKKYVLQSWSRQGDLNPIVIDWRERTVPVPHDFKGKKQALEVCGKF